jgi:uncharacterized membrane protein YphA (DoxX/SURF4 family)
MPGPSAPADVSRGAETMHATLWTLQIVLALLYFSGGAYKTFQPAALASELAGTPAALWVVLGLIEIIGAVLLVVPALTRWMPSLTPMAAVVLTVETLALAALYARYSLNLTVENPLVWAVAMAALVAFVAYGRLALRPLV